MTGGVTRHMLPHLSGVPHLHVNRPLRSGLEGINNNMQNIQDYLLEIILISEHIAKCKQLTL